MVYQIGNRSQSRKFLYFDFFDHLMYRKYVFIRTYRDGGKFDSIEENTYTLSPESEKFIYYAHLYVRKYVYEYKVVMLVYNIYLFVIHIKLSNTVCNLFYVYLFSILLKPSFSCIKIVVLPFVASF